jgi:hypothetical protein
MRVADAAARPDPIVEVDLDLNALVTVISCP